MGAGNNFLRCTAAEGGRERPGRPYWVPAGRAQGVLISAGLRLLEQVRRREVPSLANPPSRGKEQCGAAKWPRLRRHLADKIRLPLSMAVITR